jgi:hypothetical protein
MGILATGEQCNNKYKAMKKDYRACKDRNATSGSSPKYCKFYNEFDEAYGCKASTVPSFIMASLPVTRSESSSSSLSVSSSTATTYESEHSTVSSKPPGKGKKPRKTRAPACNPVVEYLEGYERRCEENESKRIKMLKEMHDDRMKLLSRFLDVMEKKQ